MSFRPSPHVREALAAAVARTGRSLSQEAEQRLERQVQLEADDPLLRAFFEAAPNAIRAIERIHGSKCSEDEDTRKDCVTALKQLVDVFVGGLQTSTGDGDFAILSVAQFAKQWSEQYLDKISFDEKWSRVKVDSLAYRLYQVDQEHPETAGMTAQARNARRKKTLVAVHEIYPETELLSEADAFAFATEITRNSLAMLKEQGS